MIDGRLLTKEEQNALITDPVNRGLSDAQVRERLGPTTAGSVRTVRRVRAAAGLNHRGYPLHAARHFEEADALKTEAPDDHTTESIMSRAPDGRPAVKLSHGHHLRRRRPTTRARRWPSGRLVYFIQPVDGGPIKIGCTHNLDQRFDEISAHSPLPLTVLGFIHGHRAAEQHLHGLFAADRLHGEWFRPSQQLCDLAAGRLFLAADGRLRARSTEQLEDS